MKLTKLRDIYIETRAIARMPVQISKIPEIVKGKSYYPNKKRKSDTRIFIENLLWVVKNQEVNYVYNSSGLDIKNWRSSDKFLSRRHFIMDRNSGNSCEEEDFSYNYLAVLRDKYTFSSYLAYLIGEDKIVPTIALYSNKEVYLLSEKKYISLEEFFNKDMKVFCKINNGECSEGVFLIEKKGNDYLLNNKESSLTEIESKIEDSNFIFQDIIQQHDFLNKINSLSVNSLRIITVRGTSGQINIFGSFLRLGSTKDSFVDNTSAGGLAVGIDQDGKLGKYGFYKESFGTKTESHPISNTVFEGCQIPYWDEIKDLVEKAHKQFYYIQSIGWDVAITPNGPILIEGNDNWEIDTAQIIEDGLKERWNKLRNS